jgi:valyl-tRNA synthetase
MMNMTIEKNELPDLSRLELEDKWILSKLNTLIRQVTENLDNYELGVASAKVYDFIWDDYCDWYIELTKARLYSEDEESKQVAQQVLVYVLDQFLRLLHPFMPFITEEIWQAIPHSGDFLMVSQWPEYNEGLNFPADEAAMETVMNAIRAVRNRRADLNVPPSRKSSLYVVTEKQDIFDQGAAYITKLAYANELIVSGQAPAGHEDMVSAVTSDAVMYMPMNELVDIEKELARLAKEIEKAEKNISGLRGKLSNESFVARAPEQVVKAERERLEKAENLLQQLKESEARLKK